MRILLFLLLGAYLIFIASVTMWMTWKLPLLPKHLRRKEEALHYESMVAFYKWKAERDPRYAEFIEYYRHEYEKRKKWLE
jgi:hypothetical protein